MSIKSYIFFAVLFGIILFGYFYNETFNKYFPLNYGIKIFLLMIGLGALFFPSIIKKWKEGDDLEDIKKHMIKKYIKK